MNWNRIPQELRDLPQWCCAGEDHAPIDPRTGRMAESNDPSTWATFDQAAQAGYPYIGLMLWTTDPYCIIDLDNKEKNPATPEELERYQAMIQNFDSYAEFSCSGRGYHIIVKASLIQGRRRDKVEVYSSHRFMICTGATVHDRPIADRQELVDNMISQMEPTASASDLIEYDPVVSDAELIEMASNASNGHKFDQLCRGEWQQEYESQSEADFALMTMLCYYTRSNDQVRRLFRMSKLGQREKAWRDGYLNTNLKKIRGKQPPPVDLTNLRLPDPIPTPTPTPPPHQDTPPGVESKATDGIPVPPGLVGEVALYIFHSSGRPVWEVSLCAAMALISGITGRHYNTYTASGLSNYYILLARTGRGKEEAAKGMDRILSEVCRTVPPVDGFLGPGKYASGQAMVRALDDQPCMVSVLGEFGLLLEAITDPRGGQNSAMLRQALLDIYGKSGWGQMLRSSAYSDKDKNTKTIMSPALTLLGESTPEAFYSSINEKEVSNGLIPRFLLIEHQGDRPSRNKQAGFPPDPTLVQKMIDLTTTVLHMHNNSTHVQVPADPQALQRMDDFDLHCDRQVNQAGNPAEAELWTRAHLKVLKLASLLAVGVNHQQPIVDAACADWAIQLVHRDIATISQRFETGQVGQGEHNHEGELRKAIKQYFAMDSAKRASYKVPAKLLDVNAVPYTFIRRRLRALACFKNDRRGPYTSIKMTVQDACEAGIIQEVPTGDARAQWGISTPVYVLGDQW